MSLLTPTSEISCTIDGDGIVLIRAAVLEHVFNHRQARCWKREAGGQLFARIGGNHWTIEQATGPRHNDSRSRFGFRPDRPAEQREIREKFALGLHYVGDWHTHPESHPKPSAMDVTSMQQMVRASRHELPGFLLLILGTSTNSAGLWISMHHIDGSWQQLRTNAG